MPPQSYAELARLIKQASQPNGAGWKKFTVISFNYDICMDYALFSEQIPIRYSLEPVSGADSVALLKLHGSLNWGECSHCHQIVPWQLSGYFKVHPVAALAATAKLPVSMKTMSQDVHHCSNGEVSGPFVVPPTWNKSQYHVQLEEVWRAAATELSDAENIFICGYSLPDTDQFFRYLYALGTIGSARLKRLWVFNPDGTREQKFHDLLGQGALPRFKFYPERFEGIFRHIRPALNLI